MVQLCHDRVAQAEDGNTEKLFIQLEKTDRIVEREVHLSPRKQSKAPRGRRRNPARENGELVPEPNSSGKTASRARVAVVPRVAVVRTIPAGTPRDTRAQTAKLLAS